MFATVIAVGKTINVNARFDRDIDVVLKQCLSVFVQESTSKVGEPLRAGEASSNNHFYFDYKNVPAILIVACCVSLCYI